MKQRIWPLMLLGLLVWLTPCHAGEVLGHISDESAPAVAEPVSPAANDRRIIYRVICTPGGEALPDCEQPFHDTESVAKPVRRQDTSEPDADEHAQPVEKTTQPVKAKKSKKTASTKKKAVKKARKTTSSKKKAAKKK